MGQCDTSDDQEMTGNEDNRDSPELSDNVESESSAHERVTSHSYVIYNISLFYGFSNGHWPAKGELCNLIKGYSKSTLKSGQDHA